MHFEKSRNRLCSASQRQEALCLCNAPDTLPPFTLVNPFSAHKQACGPEARALRAKSIGGKRNPAGDLPVLPQNEAGESGAQAGVPTSESPGSQGKEKLARPAQEMKRASWFLRATPLLLGQAPPEIHPTLRQLGEK
jgi:hypothetical protein